MRRNLDTLGWAFTFYGALLLSLTLLGSLAAAVMVVTTGTPTLLAVGIVGGLGLLAPALAAPFLVTGQGLLARRRWARPVALALSVLSLGDVPIGMALGVFGLMTLLRPEARQAFA